MGTSWPLARILQTLISQWSAGNSVILVEQAVEITDALLRGEQVAHRLDQEA